MAKAEQTRTKARKLRKAGHSVREVAKRLKVGKSTVQRWVSDVELATTVADRYRMQRARASFGKSRKNGATQNGSKTGFLNVSAAEVSRMSADKNTKKFLCALLYWTHGARTTNYVSFTETDPLTMRAFVKLLRMGFELDETKFRGMVYLNRGQDEGRARQFWSKLTGIGLGQFTRSHIRRGSVGDTMGRKGGEVKNVVGVGNFRVNYYDAAAVRELVEIGKAFVGRFG